MAAMNRYSASNFENEKRVRDLKDLKGFKRNNGKNGKERKNRKESFFYPLFFINSDFPKNFRYFRCEK